MKITKRVTGSIVPPRRKYPSDAGIDLFSFGDYKIEPHSIGIIRTGVSIEIPKNCMGWITNKSSSNFLVGAGVVDEGYQGEILIKVFNVLSEPLIINHGKAVAQLIILPILRPDLEWVLVDDFFSDETQRGERGGIHDSVVQKER